MIPSVTFLLYGLAGPRFDLSTGLRLDAGVRRQPRWTLAAPIDLTAQLEIPNFKQFNVGPMRVYSTRPVLAQAGTQPGPQPQPTPGEGERARIVWDTDDTDVDLHVWDTATEGHAWYFEQDGITDGELSSDITTGFGPEWFTDFDAPSTRTLAYGLCYYRDNGHGATDVNLRIIDPDGTAHDSHQVLYATGDSVFLGSSPAGDALAPEPGWCRGN